ncbi:hypothetical protein MRX96_010309 [Rhipicephalus microplus]
MPDNRRTRLYRLSGHAIGGVNWRRTRFAEDVPQIHVCCLCGTIPASTVAASLLPSAVRTVPRRERRTGHRPVVSFRPRALRCARVSRRTHAHQEVEPPQGSLLE